MRLHTENAARTALAFCFAAVVLAGARLSVAWAGEPCEAHWDNAIGQPGVNTELNALTVFDDGGGPALYAGGYFTSAGGVSAKRIAKWDGISWSPLGDGMEGNSVRALVGFDDGSGPALYAGGLFAAAAGSASSIAKWDGVSWSALSTGMQDFVHALAVFDDGSGPALYAGGEFTSAGGTNVNFIAKWDGESWSPVGAGTDFVIFALAVFDDGSGPALFAGGGGVFATAHNYIAKWDGASWSTVGAGLSDYVNALTVFDDGSGPALYAGGYFTVSGSTGVAKWDGSTWTGLRSGVGGGFFPHVNALLGFNDGSGPALYVGGSFTAADIVPASNIAKWDPAASAWSALGSGVNERVHSMAVHLDDTGPGLYVGGQFTTAGGQSAGSIAAWRGCPAEPECGLADLNCDGAVDVQDLLILLANWGDCPPPEKGDCPADLNGSGTVDVQDLLILLANWG